MSSPGRDTPHSPLLTLGHDPADPASADRLLHREWLLTQGRGGYAMGTALGCRTRRYHGLLVAAADPPVGRLVVLSDVIEQLVLTRDDAEQVLDLSTQLFTDGQGNRVLSPGGHRLLQRFDKGLTATWHFAWGELSLTRELVLHDQRPAASLHYTLAGPPDVIARARLQLRPLLALRDFHGIDRAWGDGPPMQWAGLRDTLTAERSGRHATLHCLGGTWRDDPQWWRGFWYPRDAHRGQEDREDVHSPGVFDVTLADADGNLSPAALTATLGQSAAEPVAEPAQRRQSLAEAARHAPHLPPIGLAAADDFVVQRVVGGRTYATILAGYPWFADWGRDTFIALPGLLLTTGRHAEAADVLRAFATTIDNGLVPNRFDDYDASATAVHYNTVDASLWFVTAALQYHAAGGDHAAWTQWLGPACCRIIDAYAGGTQTRGGEAPATIAMGEDGLIAAGTPNTQLTWMDAAFTDPSGRRVVATPRHGRAVEINALWHHALVGLADRLPRAMSKQARRYAQLAKQAAAAFGPTFWNEQRGYLADHVWTDDDGHDHVDDSLRPNQLLAVSLPHSPLDDACRPRVVQACTDHLLTPVGMRTRAPGDPRFCGRYAGPQHQRDAAYHQGTVWPWLIGPYAEAVLRVGGFSVDAKQRARRAITPLLDRLTTPDHPGSLGQLHEIYDGQPDPDDHTPRGCPAQAWSVAEVLRIADLIERGDTGSAP
jgi:predicted glycogen debranching enzyme